MEVITKNETETIALAQKLAADLQAGDILALYGDLGGGKTTFAKGLAQAFGIDRPIASPTFVFVKNYRIKNQESRIKELVHVDAYRMNNERDAEAVGLPEYFDRNDSVTVIEWPERIESILPSRTKRIRFEYVDESTRKIAYN